MELLTDIRQVPWERAAVSIGKFEGLHVGHHTLLRRLEIAARQKNMSSVVFTFDISPRQYFGQGRGNLFTKEERRNILTAWNLQYLTEYPFTQEFACMCPEQFVEEILIHRLRCGYLTVGENFRFGKERGGDTKLLERYASESAFELEIIGRQTVGNEPVSSTHVRRYLEMGNMECVAEMLGFAFFLEGQVVEGNHLGRSWGIPTANIIPAGNKLLPPKGVYFSRVCVDGKRYYGITNIGNKPTIGNHYANGVETYLYHYEGNLYGRTIRVELMSYHRPEQKFDSKEALIERLRYDISCGETYFGL